jgi:dienelactone hydrolase
MKIFIAIIISIILALNLTYSQKPALNNSDFEKWPLVEQPTVSSDGKFVVYLIENQPSGNSTLMIASTEGEMSIGVTGAKDAIFSDNSKFLFYRISDSLCILDLASFKCKYIASINTFELIPNSDILIYSLDSLKNKIFLSKYPYDKYQACYEHNSHLIGKEGKFLVVNYKQSEISVIRIINLLSGCSKVISNGKDIIKTEIDGKEEQIIFTSFDNNKRSVEYWHFNFKDKKANLLISDSISRLDSRYYLKDDEFKFLNSGSQILFSIAIVQSKESSVKNLVRIRSYREGYIDNAQYLNNAECLMSFNLLTKKFIRIQRADEQLRPIGRPDTWNDEYYCTQKIISSQSGHKDSLLTYLISATSGSRRIIPNDFYLSPGSKYILYYKNQQYYCIDLKNDRIRCISQNIKTIWKENRYEMVNQFLYTRGVAAWMNNDKSVLIYDNYDIWKINLDGHSNSVNLTNAYGVNNSIIFHLLNEQQIYNDSDTLILTAFNSINKYNGFYKKIINSPTYPLVLTMGPFIYYSPDVIRTSPGIPPVKAQRANVFVLKRMSSSESPNIYFTSDFANFKLLSHSFPEKKFNWLRTELHHWKKNNSNFQGVLFKPENFDSTKKYPLIFYYYEKLSGLLNEYITPVFSDGRLNIPWYVSNGYLVFTPDISINISEPGESALITVESAIDYLSKFDFVDTTRLGLQGGSYGGYETNYIITHSSRFKAAASSYGAADFISYYCSPLGNMGSQSGKFEFGQFRMGATLWDAKEKYLKNSPILNADKITTPVLLMHSTNDISVPFTQSMQFFQALKRLGKKVWFLEYDEGNHGIWGKSAEDYTIRQEQFFNYYLKNELPPEWMFTID